MNLLLSATSNEDYAYLWEIYCKGMRQHIEEIWGWDDSWQEADFNGRLKKLNTFLIIENHRKLGYIQFSVNDSTLYINMIILDPRFRSKGTGSSVFAELLAMYPNREIELRCFKVNHRAYKFYIREGFIVIETEDHSYLMRRG